MTRGHNIIRRLASQSSTHSNSSPWKLFANKPPGPLPTPSICQTCLQALSHRRLASSATVAAPASASTEPPPLNHVLSPEPLSTSNRTSYKIKTAVLLSRPPVITRDLTPFEKAFFLYQKRLNERLALPFTRYFYYQKGTPGDVEWKRKIKERQTPARDIGVYNAYSEDGWNDEVLVGARESEPEEQVEALIKDAQVEVKEGEESSVVKKQEVERPYPRVTDADKPGDVKSLNRLLQRTLYLLVKTEKNKRWGFPSSFMEGKESLHTVRPPNSRLSFTDLDERHD